MNIKNKRQIGGDAVLKFADTEHRKFAPFFYEAIKIRYPEYTREKSIERAR